MGAADAQTFFGCIIWITVVIVCIFEALQLGFEVGMCREVMSGWSLKFWRGYCLVKLPLHSLYRIGLAQSASVLEVPVPQRHAG